VNLWRDIQGTGDQAWSLYFMEYFLYECLYEYNVIHTYINDTYV
jgi:hypothetical protein